MSVPRSVKHVVFASALIAAALVPVSSAQAATVILPSGFQDQIAFSGLKSAFNFLAGGGSAYDGSYSLEQPWFRRLLRRIHGDRLHQDLCVTMVTMMAMRMCMRRPTSYPEPSWRTARTL